MILHANLHMSNNGDPERGPEGSNSPFGHVNVADIIGQLAAPFASLDLPPGFSHVLTGRLEVTALLLAGIKSSTDPNGEISKLSHVARAIALEEQQERRFGHAIKDIREAGDYRDPAIRFDFGERAKFCERMTKVDGSSRLVLARKGHTWQAEKNYEPYEHPGIEAIGVRMSTNPLTGTSEVVLSMKVHPETPVRGSDGSVIDSLLQVRDVGRRVFEYNVRDTSQVEYKTRTGRGRGVAFVYPDESRVIIELNGHNLTMTHSTKLNDMPTVQELSDLDDAGRKAIKRQTQDRMKVIVSSQLDFVTTDVSAFLDHVALIWGQELPDETITPRIGARAGDLGLFDLDKKDEIDASEVPATVTDQRQRELYLQTARPNPQTTFEMIGGLTKEVKQVRRAIKKAMSPERYEQAGRDPRATLLLIGPPGAGKTMIVEAIANEVDGIFLAVKGSDIGSFMAGEAEKNVAAIFDLVDVLAKDRKVVLFFDEIEAVAPSRNGMHMMEHERKITAEFLAALNRKYLNAIIIGATNAPINCDPAVTRPGRFTDTISIGNPGKEGRVQIIKNWLEYYRQRATIEVFSDVDIDKLADSSEGLNGSDLRTIVETALDNEVDAALEENRVFKALGTTALLGHIQVHRVSSEQRFANYLSAGPSSDRLSRQPQVLLVPHP